MKKVYIALAILFFATTAHAESPTPPPFSSYIQECCQVGKECKIYFRIGGSDIVKLGQRIKIEVTPKIFKYDVSSTNLSNFKVARTHYFTPTKENQVAIPFVIEKDGEYKINITPEGYEDYSHHLSKIIFAEDGKLYSGFYINDIFQSMPTSVRNKALERRARQALDKFDGRMAVEEYCTKCDGNPAVNAPGIVYSNHFKLSTLFGLAKKEGSFQLRVLPSSVPYLPIQVYSTIKGSGYLQMFKFNYANRWAAEKQGAKKNFEVSGIVLPDEGDSHYVFAGSDQEFSIKISLCKKRPLSACWEGMWK